MSQVAVIDAGDNSPIPPRTIEQRIRLAIYWSLQGAVTKGELPDNLAEDFLRQLGYVGLKLVWADGKPIPEGIKV